jgi:hypothetical protein
MKKAALLLALALAAPLWAADVKVPAEVKVAPGRLARIVVETKGKDVQYVNVYDNADIFREYDPAAFVFRFLADAPGRYKIGFYAPDASPSPAAYCWVVVGDAPPPVPPGPTPDPPGPAPDPADPLPKALRAAYAADPDPQKAARAPLLAALYRNAAGKPGGVV